MTRLRGPRSLTTWWTPSGPTPSSWLLWNSLTLLRELGSQASIALCLASLAGVTDAQGQPERAVRLFGAAEALRDSIGAAIETVDRPDYDRNLAAVRADLDEQVFAAAWSAGRAMTLEQAIATALEGPPEVGNAAGIPDEPLNLRGQSPT